MWLMCLCACHRVTMLWRVAGNDWLKERQFSKLTEVKSDTKCTVRRAGREHEIRTFDLVVGDILRVEAGDEIPADGIVTMSRELTADESSLTGSCPHVHTALTTPTHTSTLLTSLKPFAVA
eukprot:GHVT01102103.1.p1 GENE.GHVT01102103.1~~GHVT01102103.1.p1  ORF type:complete len:121 (+),score=16.49 GHVT01102103.1:410-772(+)